MIGRPEYPPEYDAPEGPSDSEMLERLDAYGHLAYTVGNEDWVACADFIVYIHPDHKLGDILVAYHVVVDCESGGFIDTMSSGVLAADELLEGWFPLWGWADICAEHYAGDAEYGPPDYDEVEKTAKRWTEELRRELKRAREALAAGVEIPASCSLMLED